MCDDPTCEACSIKRKVDDEARVLAASISELLRSKIPSFINQDYSPLIMIRALQGVTAALCAKAGRDGDDTKYSMLAIQRAIGDLLDIFSQMDGGITAQAKFEFVDRNTDDSSPFDLPRLKLPPMIH